MVKKKMEKKGCESDNRRRRYSNSSNGSVSTTTMPSWLLSTLSDLDERMKTLGINTTEEDDTGDTFAERAECYYRKRPQLLALLQDLYNGYTSLSDRYIQTLSKHGHHHRRHSSQISSVDHVEEEEEEDGSVVIDEIDSVAESSLSYQHSPLTPPNNTGVVDGDAIVADLVIKNVEYDILQDEINVMERGYGESSRKIGLQKSLLEVLESERLILLNENARLGYRVKALVEENKGLATESIFMKRKASELARCVLKMREDHRVYMLNRKIEDLQGQIFGLEKSNREYHEQLGKKDHQFNQEENNIINKKKNKNGDGVESLKQKLKKSDDFYNGSNGKKGGSGKGNFRWWEKVKNMDMFLCGINTTST